MLTDAEGQPGSINLQFMCWQLRATVGKFLNCKLCFSSLELTCLFWVWQLWRHLKKPILWHISSSSHPKPSLKKMLEKTIWRLWKWKVFFAKIPGIIHLGIIILWSRITAQNIYPFLSHISLWTLKNSHNFSLPPLVAKLLRTTIPWHSFYFYIHRTLKQWLLIHQEKAKLPQRPA